MTSNEINIMVGGGLCVIRDLETGHYVHSEQGHIKLLPNKKGALVYHYIENNVPEQLEEVGKIGANWEAVPA